MLFYSTRFKPPSLMDICVLQPRGVFEYILFILDPLSAFFVVQHLPTNNSSSSSSSNSSSKQREKKKHKKIKNNFVPRWCQCTLGLQYQPTCLMFLSSSISLLSLATTAVEEAFFSPLWRRGREVSYGH
jgi:hypothetical protein